MRSESELLVDFKDKGNDQSPSFWRERVLLEVLLDVRTLLNELLKKF